MTDNMIKDIVNMIDDLYEGMYDEGITGAEKDLETFELLAGLFPGLLAQIVKARGDMFTSDRECAAYARVVGAYLKQLTEMF